MAFSVTFVFTVTLSVFPAITVDVKTVYGGKWGTKHILIYLLCSYNDRQVIKIVALKGSVFNHNH